MECPKDFNLLTAKIRARLGKDSEFQFRNSSFLACNFFAAAAFSSQTVGSPFTGSELSCCSTAPMQAQHIHNRCPTHIVPGEEQNRRGNPFAMSEPAGTIKGTVE